MITKEKFRSIRGTVILLLVVHLSTVNGCSKGPETTANEAPDTSNTTKDCPEYVCNDNKNCFTKAQQCDGNMDCDDNTDEDNGHCGTYK